MTPPLFSNYLRANRKRLALSQKEVAFLLGDTSEEQVSRFEKFHRQPRLELALAFEVIFQRSVNELFSGWYREIEKGVGTRAKVLARKLNTKSKNASEAQKIRTLLDLAARIQN